jgi:hypothetical protein
MWLSLLLIYSDCPNVSKKMVWGWLLHVVGVLILVQKSGWDNLEIITKLRPPTKTRDDACRQCRNLPFSTLGLQHHRVSTEFDRGAPAQCNLQDWRILKAIHPHPGSPSSSPRRGSKLHLDSKSQGESDPQGPGQSFRDIYLSLVFFFLQQETEFRIA